MRTRTEPAVEPRAAPLGVSVSSAILRLPSHLRARALERISANANAPGGCKKQNGGRAQRAAAQRLSNTLLIYPIEVQVTGALAASLGGPVNSVINAPGGTPASVSVVAPALTPVTWATGGAKTVTTSGLAGSGQATFVV